MPPELFSAACNKLLDAATSKGTTARDAGSGDDGSGDSTAEDSETLESVMRTSAQAHPHEQETDYTVLPSASSVLTCADKKVDLSTLDLDEIDTVDMVARGIHRTHCSSKEEDIHSGSEDEDFSYSLLRYVP